MNVGTKGQIISKKMLIQGALVIIFLLGIFFRTYHFHDWLQFSPDEVRDATVVRNVIDGKVDFPLLGPIAGGTNFHLGPVYYYFEIASAKIFGNTPDKMAYFDLFTSLLAIPFLFFFLKKYFTREISLALSALMSVSYFFVYISRFASNPNSIPFFTLLFLYSIFEMMEEKTKKSFLWPLLVGVALGVGVQLHTLLLLIMPTTVVVVFLWLALKKNLSFLSVLFVIIVSLLINTPQIINEVQTNGSNIEAFFLSSNVQSKNRALLSENVFKVISCQLQANAEMVSSLENVKGCGDMFEAKMSVRKYRDTPGVFVNMNLFQMMMVLSVLFSGVGYFLFGYYYRKEQDTSKKRFLSLLILYNSISLLFFLPVASHMELRYYVILFFMPFLLLGFWCTFLIERISKWGSKIFIVGMMVLFFSNMAVIWKASLVYQNYQASDTENSVLGEMETLVSYIIQSSPSKVVSITGEKAYVKRFFPALVYLGNASGTQFVLWNDATDKYPDAPLFHLASTSVKKQKVETISGFPVLDMKQFGKVTLSRLR